VYGFLGQVVDKVNYKRLHGIKKYDGDTLEIKYRQEAHWNARES
jgi:hypothetical protein